MVFKVLIIIMFFGSDLNVFDMVWIVVVYGLFFLFCFVDLMIIFIDLVGI